MLSFVKQIHDSCRIYTIIIYFFVHLLLCRVSLARKVEVRFELPEESPIDTLIGNLRQKLLSSGQMTAGELDRFQYQFLGDNRYFRIDQTTGAIYVSSRIDRESLCLECGMCCSPSKMCSLSTLVLDPADSGSSDQTMIDLFFEIVDINDNTPSWRNRYINLDIPEHTPIGTRFRLPTAKDADQGPRNTTVRYAIKFQSHRGAFSLEQRELTTNSLTEAKKFNLWLQVDQELDREKQDSYQVTVSAYDGGSPSHTGSVTINITVSDINDQPPVFQSPTERVLVMENLPVHKEIFKVKATDPDPSDISRLHYSLDTAASDDVQRLFKVDGKTGSIYLSDILDYEKIRQPYQVPIVVSDGKHRAYTTLTVDVANENDNKPTIYIHSHLMRGNREVWIGENLKPRQLVATITVNDADDRLKQETVRCQTNNPLFAIEPLFKGSKNRLKLITMVTFDREYKTEYYVTIECWDSGQPPKSNKKTLKVNVEDKNDSPPVFMQPIYFVKLRENAPFNSTVTSVTATDNDADDNSQIRYSLDNYSQSFFAIDPRTGVITTRTVFDREQTDQVNITVTAEDRGFMKKIDDKEESSRRGKGDKSSQQVVNTATSVVIVDIVDINDCIPRFLRSSYEFFVEEGETMHHVIGTVVAEDDDKDSRNNLIRYSMVPTPGDELTATYFGVNSQGKIYVRSSQIDREKTPVVTFQVMAVDNGSPPQSNSVNVIVRINDINDHSPIFTFPREGSHTVNISYELTVGHKIAEIKATDRDYGPRASILYSITGGNEYDYFQLDSTSGFLYLAKALTKKDIRMHKLFLKAEDQGKAPRSSNSVLDINVLGSSVYLEQNGNPMEKDLVIMICMIAVTLVISVVLIAAIIFLRCIRCRPLLFKRRPCYPRTTRICFPDGRSSPALSEIPHLCKQPGGIGSPMLSRLGHGGGGGVVGPPMTDPLDRERPPLYYTMESKISMLGDTDSMDSGRSGCQTGQLKLSGFERSANTLGRMPQVHYFNKDCSTMLTKSIDSKRPDTTTSTMPRLATFRAAVRNDTTTLGGGGGTETLGETPKTLRGGLSVSWMDEPGAYQNLREDSIRAVMATNKIATGTWTASGGERLRLDSGPGIMEINESGVGALADRSDADNSVDGLELSGECGGGGEGDGEWGGGEEYDMRTYTPLKHSRVSSPNLYSNQPASFV